MSYFANHIGLAISTGDFFQFLLQTVHQIHVTIDYRSKQECPNPGECNQSGVVYQATVKNTIGQEKTYIGLASNFRSRL